VLRAFAVTEKQLKSANHDFRPAVAGGSPATTARPTDVIITTSYVDIDLVATFRPVVEPANGIRRVAAKQTIVSCVDLDFSRVLPLHWMASVLKAGDLAPNLQFAPYSSDADVFTLQFGNELTVRHTADGAWQIPTYAAENYTLNVGFGLGVDYACWGYSVECNPRQDVTLRAGSYVLVRSDGQEQIGDPVAQFESWPLALGTSSRLAFNASGIGTLTPA
jgi:hypothetical protein